MTADGMGATGAIGMPGVMAGMAVGMTDGAIEGARAGRRIDRPGRPRRLGHRQAGCLPSLRGWVMMLAMWTDARVNLSQRPGAPTRRAMLAALLTGLVAQAPARAARDGRAAGGGSLAQSAERVRQATGGRILDAREVDGQHRIKVLTPRGEVRIVWVDPRSGAMR